MKQLNEPIHIALRVPFSSDEWMQLDFKLRLSWLPVRDTVLSFPHYGVGSEGGNAEFRVTKVTILADSDLMLVDATLHNAAVESALAAASLLGLLILHWPDGRGLRSLITGEPVSERDVQRFKHKGSMP